MPRVRCGGGRPGAPARRLQYARYRGHEHFHQLAQGASGAQDQRGAHFKRARLLLPHVRAQRQLQPAAPCQRAQRGGPHLPAQNREERPLPRLPAGKDAQQVHQVHALRAGVR